ncbi:hypothetical protein [Thermosipho globiformans]|uniref:hypothetical protein n=1 Tax=Thermosipho globiformans TaxID=380685 RepID=UPI000F8F28C8|nr:hypothetical protein [Thermosipho globiformans]
MDGWKEISEILKKEVISSNLSLLEFSKRVGIDINTFRKYYEGNFSGDPSIVEKQLRKIKEVFNLKEDLIMLYELGNSKRIKDSKISKSNLYIFLIFTVFLFISSVILFLNVYETPLVRLDSIGDEIKVNGKVAKTFFMNEGEYIVEGPSLLKKINKETKKVVMEKYKVVVGWEK